MGVHRVRPTPHRPRQRVARAWGQWIGSCPLNRVARAGRLRHGARAWNSFDASKVKLLTGGDRLTARHMRQDFFDFAPSHTLIMLSNYKPQADSNDAALWRRVQLVPFEVVIPEKDQDRELAEKIRDEEAPGVLRWIVEGALQWQEHGLDPPDVILEQTAAYRKAEDVIGNFIEECCVRNKAAKVKGGVFYTAFRDWCQSQGVRTVRGNDFASEIQGRGFGREKTKAGAVYHGIGLHAEDNEEDWHG